jgi:Family of unknown function (DUF6282)
MDLPRFDPHLHAAPSTRPRWGDDLDVVDSAARHGLRGFVLKSHHEPTAARARIATAYAQRAGAGCVVLGSVTLNPWVAPVEVERALGLGARVIWWPTLDEDGRVGGFGLPAIHDAALELAGAHPGTVLATGHLALAPALRLAEDAREAGLPAVATHPLNPDVGVGVGGGRELAARGAVIEVDARSLRLQRERGEEPAALVRELLRDDGPAYACSDGGQEETGDPFEFLAEELALLEVAGAGDCVARLCAGSNAWLEVGDRG